MAAVDLVSVIGIRDGLSDGGGVFVPQARLSLNPLDLPATDGTPAGGGGSQLYYRMRGNRTAGGDLGLVYWSNQTADSTNIPTGTIVDQGVAFQYTA